MDKKQFRKERAENLLHDPIFLIPYLEDYPERLENIVRVHRRVNKPWIPVLDREAVSKITEKLQKGRCAKDVSAFLAEYLPCEYLARLDQSHRNPRESVVTSQTGEIKRLAIGLRRAVMEASPDTIERMAVGAYWTQAESLQHLETIEKEALERDLDFQSEEDIHYISAWHSLFGVPEGMAFFRRHVLGALLDALYQVGFNGIEPESVLERDHLTEDIHMQEVYVSTDVEADGPIPGPHSMLSFGSAAFTADGKMISSFSANLELLEGAVGSPETMEWWSKNQEAWEQTRIDRKTPQEAMKLYHAWLKALPGKPVFVGYPAAYDFLFVYWYLIRFAGESPFSHSALDIKTYVMAVLKLPYRESTKRNMPKRWFSASPHTHVALDDAIEQGLLFCNILSEHTRSGVSN